MKCVLLFPGVGTQYVGMGRNLYSQYQVAKDIFDQANSTLGFDLKKICFEGNLYKLSKMENVQAAILTVSYIMYKVYIEGSNIGVVAAAGHSLGEITALLCSGALSFEDALALVYLRGKLMQRVAGNGILVEKTDEYSLNMLIRAYRMRGEAVYISCSNSPTQFLLSSSESIFDKLNEDLKSSGISSTPLFNSVPTHCPLMQETADQMLETLNKLPVSVCQYPVYKNIDGTIYTNARSITDGLYQQLTHCVQWEKTIRTLSRLDYDYVVDIGPKSILSDMMNQMVGGNVAISLDSTEGFRKYVAKIRPHKSRQERIQNGLMACIADVISMKNNNQELKGGDYEIQVCEPYRKLKAMYEGHIINHSAFSTVDVNHAIAYIQAIVQGKRAPENELNKVIEHILQFSKPE